MRVEELPPTHDRAGVEENSIRFLGDVQRLTLLPGDTVVVSVAEQISDETAFRIRQHLAQFFTTNQVIVLGHGMKLGVMAADGGELSRIEAKLDTMIAALAEYAEDEEEAPAVDLSGNPCGRDRDQSQSLG
jgi:hypothetical protein